MSKSTAKRSNKQPGKAPKAAKAPSSKLAAIRAQREASAPTGKPAKKRPRNTDVARDGTGRTRETTSPVNPGGPQQQGDGDNDHATSSESMPSVVTSAPPTNGKYETPTTENNRYGRAAREIGPVHMTAILVKRMSVRLDNMIKRMEPWAGEHAVVFSNVRSWLREGSAKLRKGAEQLEEVPRSWRPHARVKGAAAQKRVDVGVKVAVRDNAKAAYDGMLDATDLVGLTVEAIGKGKAKVKTAKGETLFFPRGHLIPEAAPVAAAS